MISSSRNCVAGALHTVAKLCQRAAGQQGGQAVMEWIMLLGVIIVPMWLLCIFPLLTLLEKFYALTSWMIALPFP
jgi:hypothetical protein